MAEFKKIDIKDLPEEMLEDIRSKQLEGEISPDQHLQAFAMDKENMQNFLTFIKSGGDPCEFDPSVPREIERWFSENSEYHKLLKQTREEAAAHPESLPVREKLFALAVSTFLTSHDGVLQLFRDSPVVEDIFTDCFRSVFPDAFRGTVPGGADSPIGKLVLLAQKERDALHAHLKAFKASPKPGSSLH
jgi:hypothetical protein